jgi:UDP-N-acetylglucosamine 2-epimerase (non-hydrolysing)
MLKPLKLLIVAGARPNFMKVAPLIHAIQRHNGERVNGTLPIEFKLVHTGQHYDAKMSDVFFRELRIPSPDVSLEVGSGSHAVQTANIMTRFEPVCERERPDWLVVVGDVNSTMACALVASKMGIRVAHIEAGLRSGDRSMPEEINRLVTDAISDLLLTPSEDANENLRREGVPESKIRLVGNIMMDSALAHVKGESNGKILREMGLKERSFLYVTLHRPSNVDAKESLGVIVRELGEISDRWSVVFPIHPRTKKRMEEFGFSFEGKAGVRLVEPVGYTDSLALTQHARCVLTDSGGLQEESTFFRTPCLTLRPNTERPITIALGSNRLTSVERLHSDLDAAVSGPERIGEVPPNWDGRTSERILNCLQES